MGEERNGMVYRFPPGPPLPPLGWPPVLGAAACLGFAAAVFVFTALAFSSLSFFARSLISRSAFSRAAARTSDFSLRRFWMSSRDALPMEREMVTLVDRFFRRAASVLWSFLCALRYSAVHASLDAFSFWLYSRLHLEFRNRRTCPSVRASLMPLPG